MKAGKLDLDLQVAREIQDVIDGMLYHGHRSGRRAATTVLQSAEPRRCTCVGVVNFGCPEHGRIS